MRPSSLKLLSFAAGLLLFPLLLLLYFFLGRPPVAVADKPFPMEKAIVSIPLEARIRHEMPPSSPLPASQQNLIAGAGIYEDKCEMCHGTRSEPSALGKTMFPNAPQLWAKHPNAAVGVSDDPVGETYWKVKNGIRLSGMPAYGKALSEKQMWQVSLVLSMADKPLPAEVTESLAK